jgi:hypothetical protein
MRARYWGWEFDLRCDSLPRLGVKEVVCISIALNPPAGNLDYKKEPQKQAS